MKKDKGLPTGQPNPEVSSRSHNLGKRAGQESAQPGLSVAFFLAMMLTISQLLAQAPGEPFLIKNGTFGSREAHLEQLYFGANPSVYITNGQISVAGSGTPLTLFCEPASVSSLYESHPAFQGVELIQFRIQTADDLFMTLDLKGLRSFYNLKHISFLFGFDACGNRTHDCLKEKIKKILQEQDTDLGITYQLSIPE